MENMDIIVCGKNPLRQALVDILKFEGVGGEIRSFVSEEENATAALGAYLVALKSNII